jgi:hypothetical protein
MINEAKIADQKPLTANLSDQISVRDNIAALITKINSPKVTIETGKVKTLIIEPKNTLINPKSNATQR